MLGLLCILNGSLVASATMVKEREAGTLEQLLMSPAGTSEIVLAKIIPLFLLLCMMALFAIAIMRVVFDVPFHGSFLLVFAGGRALPALRHWHRDVHRHLHAIGRASTAHQLFRQSAAVEPFRRVDPNEAMLAGCSRWQSSTRSITWRYLPSQHAEGERSETLWPNFLALLAFTVILVSLSVWRFRKQLG